MGLNGPEFAKESKRQGPPNGGEERYGEDVVYVAVTPALSGCDSPKRQKERVERKVDN